ncbi:MAG: AAA family ATPase [Desulfobulbaceae bacterium]|nr:AAA family ATPase [Desulfobulbaceae bacterium]
MTDTPHTNLPDQKELEKELSDYLSRKYGERVKIVSSGILPNFAFGEEKPAKGKESEEKKPFHFNLNPEELVAYLDEYVVRQDEAKAILATKVCTHFNRIRFAEENFEKRQREVGRIKNNVLLMGPTGVGKTFLVKLIAQRLGVPFLKGDATKFSETGYVGGDVEDLIRDLVREADGDIQRAQYGIIYVDEIDKIATSMSRLGPDVSRTGVQRALLKPMEETEVELKQPHDPVSQLEAIEHFRSTGKRQRRVVNTRNILFIMSGAFGGLDEIVRKREQQQSMGFESTVTSKKDTARFLKNVRAEDLIQFGFESEFVGRLPVIAILDQLSVDDLYAILLNPNCAVVVGKKQDFLAYGIKINFENKALRLLAEKAVSEQTGARGLVSVMEKTLLHFEKKLPSSGVTCLVVTPELVGDPQAELEKLLNDPQWQDHHCQRWHELAEQEIGMLADLILRQHGDYLDEHGVMATPARLRMIAERCQADIMEPRVVCDIFVDRVYDISQCAADLSMLCGIKVSFSEEAIDHILARHSSTSESIGTFCGELSASFEYGLRLLSEKKGLDEVVITAEGIDAPTQFVNNLVSKKFQLD